MLLLLVVGSTPFDISLRKTERRSLPNGLKLVADDTSMVKCCDHLFSFIYDQGTEVLEFFNRWLGVNFRLDSPEVAVINGDIYVVEFGYDARACAWETIHLFDEVCREKAFNVAAGSHLNIHR